MHSAIIKAVKKYRVPDRLKAFAAVFKENGHSLYLVGGAVRDYLLGTENHDYDFTTDATPDEVKTMFRRTIDTGIKHGTVTVPFRGDMYEVTTFRSEADYSDMRHPDKVTFIRSLEEDLKRRDFTINAFAADLGDGSIIDLHNGMRDLEMHLIRAIGDPEERFHEDALRMLRAARFSAKLSFDIEKTTFEAMRRLAANIYRVSAERIKDELFSLVLSKDPARGLENLRLSGLMAILLPELYATVGIRQEGQHSDDVYTHSVGTLVRATSNGHTWRVRLAALFHDIGKVATRAEGSDRPYTFYGHESESAREYRNIAARLKCSNEERDSVSLLIENHMFSYSEEWTDAAVRRFIRRVGADNIPDLIDLRRDDAESISGSCDRRMLDHLEERIENELEKANALSVKDLAIDGNDLIGVGIPRGPMIGKILSLLLEEVLELPSLNRRDYLLPKAKRIFSGFLES